MDLVSFTKIDILPEKNEGWFKTDTSERKPKAMHSFFTWEHVYIKHDSQHLCSMHNLQGSIH